MIEDSSVDAILERASQSGHKYCLILTQGTIVSHAWELGLVKTIEAWAGDHPFLARAKSCRRTNSCCGILPRGLLVDLAALPRLSQPNYGEAGTAPVEVALPAPRPTAARCDAESCRFEPSGKRGHVHNRASRVGTSSVPAWPRASRSSVCPRRFRPTFLNIAPQNSQQAENLRGILGDSIATKELDPAALSAGPTQVPYRRPAAGSELAPRNFRLELRKLRRGEPGRRPIFTLRFRRSTAWRLG